MGRDPAAVAERVRVPADLRFLSVLRLAALVMASEVRSPADLLRDVGLAVDELAAVLIRAADADSELELAVSREDDLYIDMAVAVPPGPVELDTPDLTGLLLEATTQSFDISLGDRALVGVLQFSLDQEDGRRT